MHILILINDLLLMLVVGWAVFFAQQICAKNIHFNFVYHQNTKHKQDVIISDYDKITLIDGNISGFFFGY